MACETVVAITEVCGNEGREGGTQRLYMLAAKDLAPTTGTAGDPVYTVASNKMINAIGLADTKVFVEIKGLKDSVGIKDNFTPSPANGSFYFTNEFSLTLAGITTENRNFLLSVMNQPVVAIVQLKGTTPTYVVAGLNGLLTLSAGEAGTGLASADLSGYKLTFSGSNTVPLQLLDNSILASLLTA